MQGLPVPQTGFHDNSTYHFIIAGIPPIDGIGLATLPGHECDQRIQEETYELKEPVAWPGNRYHLRAYP